MKTSQPVNVGLDGQPTNIRHRTNMFQQEAILTEKEKMRKQLNENKDAMRDVLKAMTPQDVFTLFDEDDSGLISFPEFRKMLPFLDIYISDAKAFRYFRMCDTNGTGEIDVDEFGIALFICDPTSGNPVGFIPSKGLTPLDAFETFDEVSKNVTSLFKLTDIAHQDQSGFLDEDEFSYALDYLGIKISDEKQEMLLKSVDVNHTGSIDYEEFVDLFLLVCDLRKELEDRGVDVPSFAGKKNLRLLLRGMIKEEEIRERRAIAEAKRHKKWVLAIRLKRKLCQQAQFRAYQELRSALDAAGHVYVFGWGSNKQFGQESIEKLKTEAFTFENFDRVLELWRDRVRPQQIVDKLRQQRRAEEQDDKRDAERTMGGGAGGMGALGQQELGRKIVIDPYKEALLSQFGGVNVALNTAALWGRRIHHVAVSESVMFALSDTGEVFTWGGRGFWWHEIQPDSLYQTKWRGDTTPRSQLLLGTLGKLMPLDINAELDAEDMSPDDKKQEVIKVVTKYYNCWEPPPPATRMQFLDKELMPKLIYDTVKFSLECRGKHITEMTKYDMVEQLYEDITLEKRLLGERAHKAIKELETQIADLTKRKKTKLADKVKARIESMWKPLAEVQVERMNAQREKNALAKRNHIVAIENNYDNWRTRAFKKKDQMQPVFTPRGNSLALDLSGVTPRGPCMTSPRGYQAAVQISAGAAHACLVHKSGQLYTWGVGAAGRLGLDLTESGDPQKDVNKPRVVQSLAGRPVLRVSCGYAHTGAIVTGGEVYTWGSGTSGKLGVGAVVLAEECYCSVPTRVMIGVEEKRARKISCGAAHTAVITEAGQLYVFGCGDGGRLGLGNNQYSTIYTPLLVTALLEERVSSVSCGNTTTIVTTEIMHEWIGEDGAKYRKLTGGKVFVAGSRNVFGKQYDAFTHLKEIEHIAIKQVSAGYQHSVLVSGEGELFCWGHNAGGCCGVSAQTAFLPHPTVVDCMYTSTINLALNKTAYQSSTFNSRDASFAVNGSTDGMGIKKCTCTQQDAQSWLEIDLGKMALIDEVIVWNRTDVPRDPAQPRDLYTARLFPCWVMIGREPFEKELGQYSLKNNLRDAVSKIKFTENERVSKWRCPACTQGQYIRIQLESYNSLSIAEIQVMGHWGYSRGVGRVSFAAAGRDVTAVVVRASSDERDLELLYRRAAYTDALNADILRQLDSYTNYYDKYGRGEGLDKTCSVCKGNIKCETCQLMINVGEDIKKMVPAVNNRRHRLDAIAEYLMTSNKPDLEEYVVPRKVRPSKWELRKEKWSKYFNLEKWFTKEDHHITKEAAMEINPDELFEQLAHEEMNDAEEVEGDVKKTKHEHKKHLKELREANAAAAASEPKQFLNLKIGDNCAEIRTDDLSVASSSIGASVVPLHDANQQVAGMHVSNATPAAVTHYNKSTISKKKASINGKTLSVGDVLETGHVVRSAFPKSLSHVADESFEIAIKAKQQAEDDAKAAAAAAVKQKAWGKQKAANIS